MEQEQDTDRALLAPARLAVTGETSSTAVAAQAAASVRARMAYAAEFPRDWDQVRAVLIKECRRPGFAEVARYNKPIGPKGIQGPSIRFAEAALRCMKNVLSESPVVYDDPDKRIIRVTVTDLESNTAYSTDVPVEKTIERREVRRGGEIIGSRTTSTGNTVYIIKATEDDLLVKQAAHVSKAIRTNALRILPGDILEECMDQVVKTQADRAAKDPDSERKKIIDAFMEINVTPADLKSYLGHPVEHSVPAEIVDLRATYTAIKEGEATWADVLEQRRGAAATGAGAAPADADSASLKGVAGAKAALKKAAPAPATREPGEEPEEGG